MAKTSLNKLVHIPASLQASISRSRATYQNLGNSGLRVSNPILGGLHLGSSKWFPWVLDEEQGLRVLKAAYDRGINTVRGPLEVGTVRAVTNFLQVGYSQCVLQWHVGENHCQGPRRVQDSSEQSGANDQMLSRRM